MKLCQSQKVTSQMENREAMQELQNEIRLERDYLNDQLEKVNTGGPTINTFFRFLLLIGKKVYCFCHFFASL